MTLDSIDSHVANIISKRIAIGWTNGLKANVRYTLALGRPYHTAMTPTCRNRTFVLRYFNGEQMYVLVDMVKRIRRHAFAVSLSVKVQSLGYVSSREGLGAAISASARVNPHQPRRSCDCPRQISNFLPIFIVILHL